MLRPQIIQSSKKAVASWKTAGGLLLTVACALGTGCKRGFYFRTADQDAYSLTNQLGQGPSWNLKPGFTINPDQRSRFYDPTDPVDPRLPMPAPQLYNYDLPELVTAAPAPRKLAPSATTTAASQENAAAEGSGPDSIETLPSMAPGSQSQRGEESFAPSVVKHADDERVPASTTASKASSKVAGDSAVASASAVEEQATVIAAMPLAASAVLAQNQVENLPPQDTDDLSIGDLSADAGQNSNASIQDDVPEEIAAPLALLEQFGQDVIVELPPVPETAWASLPESCLRRMLEFEAVRLEYSRSFGRNVQESQLDPAERVNLENILEIALINNREYQTRKEALYRVALRLSFQQFNYDLKFLSRGNRALVSYEHDRVAGVEVNRLTTPTTLGVTRALYTAGDLTARFANDVVLTFNGPSGYSSSVGSELFIDLFQPIMQRDTRFEPLTQAERDVIYEARDFVRYRKQLFSDLAFQYYDLLLTYRRIAISTQDYFSNLREFNRAAATEQVGRIPRFQVDQFEQNVLRSRNNLIVDCNSLEVSLDLLKRAVGLPIELPINLALSELEELTKRDEAGVLREQISRKREFLRQQRERLGILVAMPAATELARSLLNLYRVNLDLGQAQDSEVSKFEILVAQLEAEEMRIEASEVEAVLKQNQASPEDEAKLLPAQVFLRSKELIQLTLEATKQELLLVRLLADMASLPSTSETTPDPDRTNLADVFQALLKQWQGHVETFRDLDGRLKDVPYAEQTELLPAMIQETEQLLSRLKELEVAIVAVLRDAGIDLASDDADLAELIESVLALVPGFDEQSGLAPLEADVDEAVLTALVQRLDLMNQRGALADQWRQIKYAGDELRSILNLRATQSIRTRPGSNKPFDFSFDDSTTRLIADFDTPLNRRSERNSYRLSLIDYNVALRNLIAAQDLVKFAVRNDLRTIELDRNQYDISIASAALAYERVTSTRLQVGLGQGNVTARDFLEAQAAYTASLDSVARQHIGYIQDRIQFFLDLEQLQVDELNFWPDLRNEDYPFLPNTNFGSTTPDGYGTLPSGPWYSKRLRRMEQVPSGGSYIHRPADGSADDR